jgi:DNA-binding beta-propeller fold protein YncE
MNPKSALDLTPKRGNLRRGHAPALGAGLLLALLAILLWAAPGARAAETIYWDNYTGDSISFANLDGSGGGPLNTGGALINAPEGVAIDSVEGRLYWGSASGGSEGKGGISYANLDGGGGGDLNTGSAEVDGPAGVAIDPATRMIYWANYSGGPSEEGSISYARLDGSGGGQLNTGTATLDSPLRVAIDPVAHRIYWINLGGAASSISYANLNGSGGGNLNLSGATPPETITGLSVDPAAGRIYWIDHGTGKVSYASLSGGDGGDLNTGGASFDGPVGMALDPAAGRLYWANFDHGEERAGAIGFVNLSGGGGGLNIATAPVKAPQDPVILKGPSGMGAPSVVAVKSLYNGAALQGVLLSCSQGTWAADFPGSFVYQAPRRYAYQWSLNGTAIGGATGNGLTATAPGAYRCAVTASNQSGSTTQTSAPFPFAGPPPPPRASLKMAVRPRKARARAGKKAARFRVWVANFGTLPAAGVSVCVRKPQKPKKARRRARKALKTPKCRKLGTIAPGATRRTKLKVKARRRARGSYKLRFVVRGGGGAKPVTRRLIAKKHKTKHRKGK